MPEDVQRINDSSQLQQICEKLFLNNTVSLREKDGLHRLEIRNCEYPHLFLEHSRPDGEVRLIHLKHKEHDMFLECRPEGMTDANLEKVKVMRLHLKRAVRKENRAVADGNMVTVRNMVPAKLFPEWLSRENNKRDIAVTGFTKLFQKIRPSAEVQLRKSFRMEPRLRAMTSYNKPIIIMDRTTSLSDNPESIPYEEYKKVLQYEKNSDKLVGEITLPLMYRDVHIYGMVIIKSETAFTETELNQVKKLHTQLRETFEKEKFLPGNPEICPVADLSASGAGFIHPHNQFFIQSMSPGEHVYLDLNLPGHEPLSLCALIRNIKSMERMHRIGVQFEDMDADKAYMLEDFVGEVAKSKPADSDKPSA